MKSGFLKNIAKVIGGNAFGKVIGVAAIPFLTRLYDPEAFAELSVLTAMVMLLGPLFHLGYAYAIPLSGSEKFRLFFTALCLLLSCAMFLPVLVILYLVGLLLVEDLTALLVLGISVGAFLGAQVEIFRYYYSRVGEFNKLSYSAVQQALGDVLIKLALGLGGYKGLVIGQSLHDVIPNLFFIKDFFKRYRDGNIRIGLRKISRSAAIYSSFPKYRLVSHVFLVLSSQSAVFLILSLYGKNSLGFYSLAIMAVNLPVTLVANSAAQVFYGEIARIRKTNEKEILKAAKGLASKLILIGLPPTVFLISFGESFFALVFGDEWARSGVFAGFLAYFMIPQMVAVNMIKIASLYNKQRFLLLVNLSRFFVTLLVFFLSLHAGFSDVQAVFFYCMAMIVHYCITSFLSLRIIRWRVG